MEEECPICLEVLGKHFVTISCCNKKFHVNCLSKSVSINNTCPMCRSKQLSAEVVVVIEPETERASARLSCGMCCGAISIMCFMYICYVGYISGNL